MRHYIEPREGLTMKTAVTKLAAFLGLLAVAGCTLKQNDQYIVTTGAGIYLTIYKLPTAQITAIWRYCGQHPADPNIWAYPQAHCTLGFLKTFKVSGTGAAQWHDALDRDWDFDDAMRHIEPTIPGDIHADQSHDRCLNLSDTLDLNWSYREPTDGNCHMGKTF
jgi:hypothetical protein